MGFGLQNSLKINIVTINRSRAIDCLIYKKDFLVFNPGYSDTHGDKCYDISGSCCFHSRLVTRHQKAAARKHVVALETFLCNSALHANLWLCCKVQSHMKETLNEDRNESWEL